MMQSRSMCGVGDTGHSQTEKGCSPAAYRAPSKREPGQGNLPGLSPQPR